MQTYTDLILLSIIVGAVLLLLLLLIFFVLLQRRCSEVERAGAAELNAVQIKLQHALTEAAGLQTKLQALQQQYESQQKKLSSAENQLSYLRSTQDECIDELKELRVGFRDSYIMDAIDKAYILDEIAALPFDEAERRLMTIRGIGRKVASCILLFGYHRMDAFPIDVWIRKVLDRYYPGKGLDYFEPYPALCQQYLFSYARSLDLD